MCIRDSVKPAVENEVQVAVNSEGKTVEATRNLKEALQSAQQRPTGEQKQQQEMCIRDSA